GRRRGRRAGARAPVGEMGRRSARGAGAGAWREGAGADRRTQRRRARRHSIGRASRASSPDPAQLPGGGGRARRRSDRRAPSRSGSVAVTGPVAPEVLARIADLELVARIVVDGLVSGLHRSPFHGYSAEFSQYRHYLPGDDLKYVDWKLVARTDRVYTKQFRETTNMAASLVLDTSASMAFPTKAAGRVLSELPVSKFRYGVVIAAALAHLISRQGDGVGLVAGDRFIPPRTGRQHLRRLLATLSAIEAQGGWRGADVVRLAAERLNRRGLLIVLSDFYD